MPPASRWRFYLWRLGKPHDTNSIVKSLHVHSLATALILAAVFPVWGQTLVPPPPLNNELTGQQISEGTRNLVICIHGVNYPQQDNRYSESWEWAALVQELRTALPKTGSDPWELLLYHWEEDAVIEDFLNISDPLDNNVWVSSIQAATFASSHGQSLGPRLPSSLRRVHILAHSTGAWVAQQAALSIMENNRFVVVQVTLLDPYVPGRVKSHQYSVSLINDLALANFLYAGRVSLLENY